MKTKEQFEQILEAKLDPHQLLGKGTYEDVIDLMEEAYNIGTHTAETTISGLNGVIESQQQTNQALVKKLQGAETAIGELQTKLTTAINQAVRLAERGAEFEEQNKQLLLTCIKLREFIDDVVPDCAGGDDQLFFLKSLADKTISKALEVKEGGE